VLLYEETRDMLAANPDINQIFAIDRRWKKQGKATSSRWSSG
jgi:heptosyltransferase-3